MHWMLSGAQRLHRLELVEREATEVLQRGRKLFSSVQRKDADESNK